MAGIEFHPPRFTLPLKSNQCDEGGTVRFEAVVTGFPIPAVTWLHNGNDVTNSINYEISADASGRCVLNIPEVFDEDAGIFTCHAINGAGEADTSAEFVVKTKTVAPLFKQHLASISARQGQSVRFEVKTTGLPAPRVKWYREGAEIRHSDDFRIVSAGDTHSLTITEAYEEDTGRFTVTAANNAGKATSTAMLTISGEGSVASSVEASPTVTQVIEQKKLAYQAERGRSETTTDGPSDSDFVQTPAAASSSMRTPPNVSPKPTRKQSPSPIRKVRMSPPRMHPALGSQQSPLPRRQIRSVKAPTPSPPRGAGVRLAATGTDGKLQEQQVINSSVHSASKSAAVAQNSSVAVVQQKASQAHSQFKAAQSYEKMEVSQSCASVSHAEQHEIQHMEVDRSEHMTSQQTSMMSHQASMTSHITSHSSSSIQSCGYTEQAAQLTSHQSVMSSQDCVDSSQLQDHSFNVTQQQTSSKMASHASSHISESSSNASASSNMAIASSSSQSSTTKPPSYSSTANAPVPAARPPKVAPPPTLPSLPPSIDYCNNPNRTIPGVRRVRPSSASRKRPLPTKNLPAPSNTTSETEKTSLIASASATSMASVKSLSATSITEEKTEIVTAISEQSESVTAISEKSESVAAISEQSESVAARAEKLEKKISAEFKNKLEIEKSSKELKTTSEETAVFPPFFKLPAKNVEVVEGEMSQFECHVIGNPTPTIKWYREGALIQSSPDFLITFDGQMSTLLIRETYVDDAGMFTCTAQNKAGSSSCSALLTVNVPETEDEAGPSYKPEVARSISETELSMTDYEGFESTELDFVSGVSDVELTDTEFVKPSASAVAHHHHLDATDGQLAKKLSPVAEESSVTPSGKQSSRQSSIAPGTQTISGAAPLLVSSPPSQVRLEEGGSLRLSFVISGSPPPNVTWAKNGKAIEHGFRFKLEEDILKHTFTMYVGMLFPEDAGEYTITATNRFGFIRGTVQLLSEDEYKMHQENTHAIQQQTSVPGRTYTAQHTLAPSQPVARGRGEARHLTPTSKKAVSPGSARMSSLSPGRYDVSDRRSVSPSKRLDEVDELDIEKYFKPRFLRKTESTECNEGTATRLDCKVTGRPLPDVMWYHNGALMHEDYSHRVVVKEDGVRSLIISPATPRDGGEYTVVAHNKAGKAVSSVTLTVIPKEGTERPRILEKPQSVNVNEGDMVRLEVFAVGRPTPEIVWLKDNVLLIPDKHPELRIEGVDGHGLLTIPVANRALHDAWYTATAVNKVGRDLTRCKVKVQTRDVEPEPERKLYIPKSARRLQPPEPSPDRIETRKIDGFDEHDLYDEKRMQKPRFKKKLVSVKQKLLGSAHFECHVVPIGDPTMKVEWLLDGKPIEFANRIMTTHEFGYCSLDISAVYPRDSGVISCRATNAHGQIQTSCTLIVKDTKGLVEKTQLPETKHLENIERREREFKGVGDLYARKDPDDDQPPHAPHIVLNIDPARVKEGEPARFRCRITGFPLPKVEWFLNKQSIRKSKRFRLWYDGIHYFEIAAVRGYDTGEVRMVATNSQGSVESSAALEVYQADDLRSVLHRADKVVSTTDGDTDLTVKRYRTSRAIEDQLREQNARKMVTQLKQVEKPSLTGQKKPMKKATEPELQSKFKQLTEEEHVIQAYNVEKKLVELADDSEAPVILERVQNVTVPKGKDARLKVRFYGKPRPEVTWFFNGKPLEHSDRISWTLIEENVSELVIRNTRKSDAGGISAIVSNAAGEAGSQGFLLVQEPNVLRFTSPLQDVSAKENDRSCMFECTLSESYVKVEWRTTAGRRGATEGYETVLKGGDKYRMNTEGNHHYLRISDIQMQDAGTYYCVVVGQDDKQSAADLVVEAVPRTITTKLKDQTSREGLQAHYEATVSHENVAGTWMKDGVSLQSSEKYEIGEVGRRRRLTVNDLVLEDEGVYEYVYNGDTSSANLTVTAFPCNITQTLSDQTAFAGNTVKFEAKVSLFGAKIYWFKNGVPITPLERISLSSEHKSHILTITACTSEDAGQYSFKAGTNESTAQLVIQEIVVTGFLQNQSVVESQSVQLKCSIDVPGYFDGIWLHNEKLITNSEYHVIETKGSSQMLTLTNVTNDDAGTYAYVTGSGTGTEAKLEVIPIKVVRPLHDITDAETKTVKLELELSHPGVEGTWWKDGIQLQGTDKHIFGSDGKVRFLEIRKLAVDDQGNYEFRAGKQMSSAHITVQGASITKPLHDTKALETGDATMECEVAGTGVRGVWKRNGVPINFDAPGCKDKYIVEGRRHILQMTGIDQDHAGTYTFEFGSKKTSAHLEIEGIKLMKALRNIHVADASDAVFAVEVSQDNVRQVKWERNGVEIRPDDPKYVMKSDGNKFTLTVKKVSHSDVAAYSFVAGSAKSSGRIYVEKIEFVRELQDQHIMEKRTAEFIVEIDNDNVTGYWEKDGVKLEASDKYLIQSERKVHQLTITNTTETDTGVYTFRVGRSSTSGKLHVETVKITSRMKPKSIKETQSATFECTVSHPDITSNMYCWMKNGKEIQTTERINKTVEGYTHRLTIHDCSIEDSGEYTFEAGKDKCSAKLDVQVVKVIRGLAPKRKVMAHETVVFEAQIDAPNVKAFWMKDGRRIDVSSRMTDSSSKFEAKSKETIHTLKVKDVNADDEGVYTLYAGRELTSSTLYVEVLQVDITKCVKTISVVEKHQATLEFKVSKPNVKAQWFRQGIEIDVNQPRYRYEIDDRTHRLYVKEVSFSDEGEYTFQAGTQRATTFLYVQPPEPPRFVQELRNCIVIAGEAAKFTVRVTGRPEPNITWYKEGITINPSFKYKILHDEDQHTLVVIGVEESDAGEYVCEARNELGSMRTKASLEVDNKDKTPAIRQPDIMAPKIVEPIQNFITREGQSARFQCKVAGTDPKVTWYVNDKRIQPSRYFKISQFHGVCQLEITEAYPEDEGVYRVTVSNAKGEVSCSAKLQLDSELINSNVDGCVAISHEATSAEITQSHDETELVVPQISQSTSDVTDGSTRVENVTEITDTTIISVDRTEVSQTVITESETTENIEVVQVSESEIMEQDISEQIFESETSIEMSKSVDISENLQSECTVSKSEEGFVSVMVVEREESQSERVETQLEMEGSELTSETENNTQVAESDAAVIVCSRYRSKFLCDVERTLGLQVVDFEM